MDINTRKEIFVALIQANKGIIFKICNTYCSDRDDIDDLSQEIVYNLWKSYASYDKDFKFSTWMYRIALNVAVSFYRKEKNQRQHVSWSESLLTFTETKMEEPGDAEKLGQLKTFIGELKEIERSIIVLYLDDKTSKEIAEIIGISETNVATRINRIKEKLRTKFIIVK